MKYLLTLILIILLTSCSNAYRDFYTKINDAQCTKTSHSIPRHYTVNDLKDEGESLTSQGYKILGHSSFNGQISESTDAVEMGQSINASLVIIQRPRYTNTVNGTYTYTYQDPDRHVVTNTGGVITNGYNTYLYGQKSVTTIEGQTHTQYQNYSINRYDQAATYWMLPSECQINSFNSENSIDTNTTTNTTRVSNHPVVTTQEQSVVGNKTAAIILGVVGTIMLFNIATHN